MRRLKRAGLALLTAASLGSLGAAIYPRIYAWNQVSQGVLIASSRSANCRLLRPSVLPNIIPLDDAGNELPPGTFVCDFSGNTGQINGFGAVDYVRQGDTSAIVHDLKQRGFKQ
jgi:hypothetical protein